MIDLQTLTLDELEKLAREGRVSLLAAAHEIERRRLERPPASNMARDMRSMRSLDRMR